MSCRVRLVIFSALFLITITLRAQEQRRISFNGFSGVALLPSSEKLNAAGQATNMFGGYGLAIAGGLGANYRFNEKYSLVNNLFYFFTSKSNFKFSVAGLKSGLKYNIFKDTKKISPYLTAGLNLNFSFVNRKQYSDSIFPNGNNVIGPGIGVSKIVYNFESLKLGFVPMPGAFAGAGVSFKLSEKVNIFVEYSYNYNLAKLSNLIKDNYFANKSNLAYQFVTAGVTFKLLKPRKQLLATLSRTEWEGDPTIAVIGTIVYKKEKKSNQKVVPVLFTNANDSTLSIEPTDTKGVFEQKALKMDDYKYMLAKRNKNILRADLQIIHDNRKVDIFEDYPELTLMDEFDSDNIISRDNNFSVILREGFQHEVDITVLANSVFGKVTPIGYDTICRNLLVLLKDMKDNTLAVTTPEKDCSFRFDNVEPGPHKIVFIRKPMVGEVDFKYEFLENLPLIKRQYNTDEDSVELYMNSIVEVPEDTTDINDLLLNGKDVVAISASPDNTSVNISAPQKDSLAVAKSNKKISAPISKLKTGKTYSPDGEELHPSGYGVQVGAFSSVGNVRRMCEKLKKTRKETVYIQVLSQDENNYKVKLYRVVVGAYPDIETSEKELAVLKSAGYETVIRKHRDGEKGKEE